MESGLHKMMVIGLGKLAGAQAGHTAFLSTGFEPALTSMGATILNQAKILAGLAITRIFVRDLTERAKGNATGIGLADYTHSRLVNKIDRSVTYDNCITAANPRSAAIPIYFDRDWDVLNAALRTIGSSRPDQARIVWIRNTLDLETLQISTACREAIAARRDVEMIGSPFPFAFDAAGNLIPEWHP
jgi:hypothetical protein